LFEVQHGVFHQMTKLVEVLVVVALDKPMLSRRDDRRHGLPGGLLEDGIGVVASVGKQVVSRYPLDQSASLRAISGGTRRNKDSERHTKRIHGQMYFGVEPPFVRDMA
jgi:hypothetical protein